MTKSNKTRHNNGGDLPDRGDGVTRRDLIHDISLAAAALSVPGLGWADDSAPTPAEGSVSGADVRYYPPTRTGLRGSHEGAFEAAHQLAREGRSFPPGKATGEWLRVWWWFAKWMECRVCPCV